jgi:hypothetical protein
MQLFGVSNVATFHTLSNKEHSAYEKSVRQVCRLDVAMKTVLYDMTSCSLLNHHLSEPHASHFGVEEYVMWENKAGDTSNGGQ